ncbi:unnamed protein product [Polarella glacialis]|uniref:Uncharacterized protein n=1 Tax=Polarella glacialis TaxID=89957 RepID=A0A813EUB2_POLGL|nr:unnamed protein product [Polarella glacialis]
MPTGDEPYYTPLCESTYSGNNDVSMWLLNHQADAQKTNKEGVTPLHFVSMRGITGGLEADDGLSKLVKCLRRAGASLTSRIPDSHYDEKLRGKIPLQLAAADSSRFPKRMMHLLAPCLHSQRRFQPRFFSDISFLTTINNEAADEIVRALVHKVTKEPDVLTTFRLDAQLPGQTDRLAGIMYAAPQAAATMMDMLMVDPEVQDADKHNFPTRRRFWRGFDNPHMTCIYRPDVIQREGVMLPAWKFDSAKAWEDQPDIAWHRGFLPEFSSDSTRSNRHNVYSVSVKSILLPNVLDIDMFMALAQTEKDQLSVFSKLSVQGMIHCLWDNLIQDLWLASMVMNFTELLAYAWWGLLWHDELPTGDKSQVRFCCAVITAGALRQFLNMGVLTYNLLRKWRNHTDMTMASMWRPTSSLYLDWCPPTLFLSLIELAFSWETQRAAASGQDFQMNDQQALLMAFNVLVKCSKMLYAFRLCTLGMRIHAIIESLLGGATREMLIITVSIFLSFSVAFAVLDSGHGFGWVIASAYRGLLYGDGDGMNNLGLDISSRSGFEHPDNPYLTALLVLGSSFFNVIILNLIIAVYGNEYDKVEHDSPLLFQHSRARNCVMYTLTCDVFFWRGHSFQKLLYAAAATLFISGLCSHLSSLSCWISAALFAFAQFTFQAAQLQCDWFSAEGVAANQAEHFVWICHRSDVYEKGTCREGEHEHAQSVENQLVRVKTYVKKRLESVEQKVTGLDLKLDAILEKLTVKGTPGSTPASRQRLLPQALGP